MQLSQLSTAFWIHLIVIGLEDYSEKGQNVRETLKENFSAVVEQNGEMMMLVFFWDTRTKKPATIFGCVGKEAEEVDKYCMSFFPLSIKVIDFFTRQCCMDKHEQA